jgi:peptide/nickel transport system permease protein
MSGNDPKDGPGRKPSETDSVLAVSASHHEDLLAELDDVEGTSDSGFDIDAMILEAAEMETDDRIGSIDDLAMAARQAADQAGNTADASASSEDLTYGDIVWGQFRKDRVAVFALWALALLAALAVYSPLLSSSQPFLWNEGEGMRSPWISSLFDRNFFENPVDIFFNLLMALGTPLLVGWLWRVRQLGRGDLTKRARRRKARKEASLLVGFLLTVFVGLLLVPTSSEYIKYPMKMERLSEQGVEVFAVFPPSRYTARQTGFMSASPPTWSRLFRDHERAGDDRPLLQHVLGTDESTRDVAVRILFGIRISLTIGVIAVGIYVFIGILLGATAGYFGGGVDLVIQRMIEIMMSVPAFFVILTIVAFLEHRSIFHIMIILGLIRWTGVARLVRGEFLRLRNLEFVTAAKALGYPEHRIIFEQILPNALGPVLVAATFGVAACILIEASLSFLGLGDLTAPSWGQMIQEGYSSGAWHLILTPGFAIFVTVSALNLVGEGLRDALDPRLRQ